MLSPAFLLLSSLSFADALGIPARTLKQAAGASGRYFGAALAQPHLQNASDPNFARVAAIQFSGVTPENEMKWESTEPTPGNFTFQDAEVVVKFKKEHDMVLRCHNLVWDSQLSPFVTELPADQVEAAMIEHIKAVAGHFKGDCFAWDVVNEPLNGDGSFVSSPFFNAIGEDYIEIALRTARAADPHAHLYINDFNTEGINAKSDAMLNLTTRLHKMGLLDGVGFESHFILNEIPDDIQANLERFAAVGLQVAITELDIRITLPATQEDLQNQAAQYAQVVQACVNVKKCVGVTTWGITDVYSWIPGTFPGEGAALLFDDSYNTKPAFFSTIKAF